MIKLPQTVLNLFQTFKDNGFQLYVVGGAVRDSLMGKLPVNGVFNWDFTTDATPDQILKLFPNGFYNNAFGTVGVKIGEDIFEITTFRKEGSYSDMRHPDQVQWAKTIEEDLARRDFTINAMAYDGKTLIDLYNGQAHLKQKIIVTVGDPDKRFSEDALRLMRAVRLAAELGFLLDEKTRDSIRKNASLIKNISGERIRDELFRIIKSENAAEGILFLRSSGLLEQILPELDACFIVDQISPKRHHIYDVGTHLVMSLKHCPSQDPITRLATLFHDIGKVQTYHKDETGLITFHNHEVVGEKIVAKIADRLKLSKKEKDKLMILVRHHQFTVQEDQTDKAIRRFIRDVTKEYLQDMLDLRTGDRIGSGATPTSWRLDLFKKRLIEVQKHVFSISDLKINGNDVMKELGLKPGRQIGEILEKLFQEVEEGRLKNERDALLQGLKDLHAQDK